MPSGAYFYAVLVNKLRRKFVYIISRCGIQSTFVIKPISSDSDTNKLKTRVCGKSGKFAKAVFFIAIVGEINGMLIIVRMYNSKLKDV